MKYTPPVCNRSPKRLKALRHALWALSERGQWEIQQNLNWNMRHRMHKWRKTP